MDDSGTSLLVDTKYKTLDATKLHTGFAQEAFYQIYAYGNAGSRPHEEIVLHYPTAEPVWAFFEQDNLRVYVRNFDPRAISDPAKRRIDEQSAVEQLSRALQTTAARWR